MNYTSHIPRDLVTAAIRSRYPQIHSGKCRCTIDPLSPEIQALKTENIFLRTRIHQGIEQGEKILLEDRLRFMQLENQKLHERILRYQDVIEQQEKSHMQLVKMVRMEQRDHHQGDYNRNPGLISKAANQNDTQRISDFALDEGFQGEYLLSLKRVKPNQERSINKSPKKRQQNQYVSESTRRKPGIKLSYERQSKKNQYNSAERMNPQQRSNFSPSIQKELPQFYELQKAYNKIRQLQQQLQEKVQLKSSFKIVQNQNQLLKLKLKNIEDSIKSYQQSTKHYQSEVSRAKKQIEDLKLRQTTGSITTRQNTSLKDSNDYLRKQFEEIQIELQREKSINIALKEDLETQKRKNLQLNQQLIDFDKGARYIQVLANQMQKQKRTIIILNQDLEAKSSELINQQNKGRRYQIISKQILQIKELLQSIDFSSIEHQERRTILQHKSNHMQLTHEVAVLTSQLQRYKQQILLLQKKIATLTADKDIITSSLQEVQKQNHILLSQIKKLQESIDKYLQEEPLPSLKITTEFRKQEIQSSRGLKVAKENIQQIIDRMGQLQGKLIQASRK